MSIFYHIVKRARAITTPNRNKREVRRIHKHIDIELYGGKKKVQSLYTRAPVAESLPTRFSRRIPLDEDEPKVIDIIITEKNNKIVDYHQTDKYLQSIHQIS